MIWLFRWLAFRIMLGAGLIKVRGDPSWRDLTALYYHFETQPIPNPLSRWFHFLPRVVLRIGTGFNHVAELVAPWFAFGPRVARQIAGGVIILFQLTIISSFRRPRAMRDIVAARARRTPNRPSERPAIVRT